MVILFTQSNAKLTVEKGEGLFKLRRHGVLFDNDRKGIPSQEVSP